MKEILRMVSHVDRHAVSNVYTAPWRINSDYLPRTPDEGEPVHSLPKADQ